MSRRIFNYQKLLELESIGATACARLSSKLEECGDDSLKIGEVASNYLPKALLLAYNNKDFLLDIKQVIQKYPNLKPVIYDNAIKLRKQIEMKGWVERESASYKKFINSLTPISQ